MSLLTISHLRKKFRNNRGIEDISFSIEEGDVFGLLGANGAGKTTTMKIIAGLMRRDSGEIDIFGEPLESHFEDAMGKIGALIETPAFYGYMSAKRNLLTAAGYYRWRGGKAERERQVDGLLNLVRLYPYRDDKAARYSLGMKQRLGIALAFVASPSFCILDEPSNGLDIEGIIEIRNIILDMAARRNVTFLVSSHQSGEIQKLCNKVAVISGGRVDGVAEMAWVLNNFPSLEEYYLYCVRGDAPFGDSAYIGRN